MAEELDGLRVASDNSGDVWDEIAGRKGYFAVRSDGVKSEHELNLWQIADRYGIDRVVTVGEVGRVTYLEARVGELHNTIGELRAELERWRSGQRRHSWPVVEAAPDGLTYAAALARAQGTEGGDKPNELLRQAAIRLRDLNESVAVQQRYEDLLGAIWLYVNWHYVTKQLTTEQKNLWADAVDAFGDPDNLGPKAERWWAELPCGHTAAEAQRSIRHELCDSEPPASLSVSPEEKP